MPVYEYICKDCQRDFSKVLTLREYEKGEVECPACKSKNVEQKPATFFVVTSKKS